MPPLSHNMSGQVDHEVFTESDEGKRKLTAQILRKVDRKFIAEKLGVSESMISHWISGTKRIPAERVFEIIKAGKHFCMDWREFEDEIDLALLQMGE